MRLVFPIIALSLASLAAGSQQLFNLFETKGSIEGTVLRAGVRTPLAGAIVDLKPADRAYPEEIDLPADDSSNSIDIDLGFRRRTDSQGRFSFRDVEPGQYVLVAARDEFLRAEYGQSAHERPGKVLVVATGQKQENLLIEMMPAPVIFGTIRDVLSNEPMAAVIVEAFRREQLAFGPRLKLARTALTDDRGQYRLPNLEPGDYLVAAVYQDDAPRPLAPGVRLTPNLVDPGAGYAVQYFPGTSDMADAKLVRVGAGGDVNASLRLKELRRADVRGVIPGTPEEGARIWLLSRDGELVPGFSSSRVVRADGVFEFRNVGPGLYTLAAETRNRTMFSDLERIAVADRNIEDLKIPWRLPLFLQGQMGETVRSLGSGEVPVVLPPSPARPGTIVRLLRAGQSPDAGGMFNLQVDLNGNFGPAGLPKGTYDVQVTSGTSEIETGQIGLKVLPSLPPPGSRIEKMPLIPQPVPPLLVQAPMPDQAPPEGDCRDLTDGFSRVCLVIDMVQSSGSGTIVGRVLSGFARSAGAARIVLVPSLSSGSARHRLGIANETGNFQLSGIPPGQYTVFAFQELRRRTSYDPRFLDYFRMRGTTVRVLADATQVQGVGQQSAPSQQYQLQLDLILATEMGEWRP